MSIEKEYRKEFKVSPAQLRREVAQIKKEKCSKTLKD